MAENHDGKIRVRVITLPIDELKLLEVNARYMRHETFQQLVNNIKRDGALTQLPFAVLDDDGKYKVLSGNHRVKAAKEAGLKEIPVLVTDDKLSKDRQIAIQLSHNAIVGEDDPAILKALYEEIEDIDYRMYSGLDDKTLELLEQVQPESLSEANLDFQTLTIVFLPEELEKLKETWEEIQKTVKSDEYWLTRFSDYDRFMDTLEAVSSSYSVKNVATAFNIMVELAYRHLDDLSEGWYDSENDEVLHRNWVPLSSVLGNDKIPAQAAAIIKRAIEKMISKEEISNKNKWQALEYWASDYLSGE